MTCADLEILLCDFVDGTLDAAQRRAVEQHLAQCAACAEMARDAQAVVTFVHSAAEVEPPPELMTRILFDVRAGKPQAAQRARWRRWLGAIIEPVLQPRFAMGMAMTILSFSMLGRFAGVPVRQLKPSDLDPVKIWATIDDKAHRAWASAVKYYESLRLVYEIQSRLREWTEQEDEGRRDANETVDERTAPLIDENDRRLQEPEKTSEK